MEFWKKKVIFSSHAFQRSIEWGFERSQIRKSFRHGFICQDKETSKKQCIYNVGNQYYTIIFQEYAKVVVIITLYHSSLRDIRKSEGENALH
ncbi:MAG: DUF4258 domain-containing protein [Candidatus Diapherotrites archaeon]